ncbi:MAG: hypothetical protein Q8P92_00065 [Candidatus Daviesbacteria bacterium]|nr:hypothetical protein [Candidatus Daviesbacteria bacterium]
MNIEGGGALSVGPAISPAVSLGTMEGGPVGGFSPSIINEGPVAPAFLENTMPITQNLFGLQKEIIFNPSVIQQAEEVAARAWENSNQDDLEIKQIKVITPPMPELGFAYPLIEHGEDEEVELIALTQAVPVYESKNKVATIPSIQSHSEPKKEEMAEEQVAIESGLEDQISKKEEKDARKVSQKRFLVDESALLTRLAQLRQAIDLAGGMLSGEVVKNFMPQENDSNRSEALKVDDPYKEYPDGGYEETLASLGLLGKLNSEQEAYNKGRKVIEENGPVRKGKNGQGAPEDHIWKTYEHFPVKPSLVHLEVENRKLKKAA